VGTITAMKSPLDTTKKEPSYDVGRARRGESVAAPPRSDGERPALFTPKVVLLRGRGALGSVGQPPATSELRLDLQGPIDDLRSIRGDLEVYYWERPGHGEQQARERYQVSLWIRQVSERTAALEGILLHLGTPSIVLNAVATSEREALRSAAALLGCWIREEEPFEQVLRTVAGVLHAADVICLGAAGGRAEARFGRSGNP
jgi:hypothetical protein